MGPIARVTALRGLDLFFAGFAVLIAAGGAWMAARPAAVIPVSVILLAGLTVPYWHARRSLARVEEIAAQLGAAAAEVAAAAEQLASANATLAQGISTQAGSLSETSGTSELMASIMRQCAESGHCAGQKMSLADDLAGEVNGGLEDLVRSIHESTASSAKIAGITKVVEEIAFQTNILALNAAVEAARAGESGAGFAVVADEVRSLAQRSSQAAHDIAELVAESTSKTREGSSKLDHVAGAMRSLIQHASEVKTILDDLVTSNDELVRGTEQISSSMRALDQITETAAATSEETAASGREMSAQAEAMQELVTNLRSLSGAAAQY